jgi:sulfite exporter TauE/SafE
VRRHFAALGLATDKNAAGRSRISLLVAYQVGRTLSYSIAGALTPAAFSGFIVRWLDVDAVRDGLRVLSAVALVAAALVAFGALRDPGARLGGWFGRASRRSARSCCP